jgi:uncharacterized protein YbjQ (UPF0145 family)
MAGDTRGRVMLFTTTSSLEGYEIEQYIGPITAHVVIGTGLLTDFFSSWTDLFGVRSRSYQNKLDEIEGHTMSLLEEKARAVSATAVIGLRVDFDEIAGAGKSMLMVTAMGTAVAARRLSAATDDARRVTAADLNEIIRRQRYIDLAEARKPEWNDETWAYVTRNSVTELASAAVAYALDQAAQYSWSYIAEQSWMRNLEGFLSRLPEAVTEPILYAGLTDSEHSHRVCALMIRQLNLLRPERVLCLLSAKDRRHRAWAVQALRADKTHWEASDATILEAIAAALQAAFTEPIPLVEEKGTFGRTRKTWACVCGQSVGGEQHTCYSCTRDRLGFANGYLSPAQARSLVEARLRALRAALPAADTSAVAVAAE